MSHAFWFQRGAEPFQRTEFGETVTYRSAPSGATAAASASIQAWRATSTDVAGGTRETAQPGVWKVYASDLTAAGLPASKRLDQLTDADGITWHVVDVTAPRRGVFLLTCQHTQPR